MAIRRAPQKKKANYRPIPGTMAERILTHVKLHPGVSVNGIITALDLNPSPARQCIKTLLEYELIRDTPNEQGHHSYTVTEKGNLI